MTKLTAIVVAVAGLLALPATGSAAQTFGSLLKNSPAPGPSPCVEAAPGRCTLVGYINPNDAGDPVPAPAPIDGVVVKLRIRTTAAESVTFRFASITQPQNDVASAQALVNGPTVTTAGTGAIEEFNARVAVPKGAHVALDAPSTQMVYNQGGNPFTYLYGPPLVVGQAARASAGEPTGELLVQAVIEPDADRDGAGDETQDECPTNPDKTVAPCDDTSDPQLSGTKLSPSAFSGSSVLTVNLTEAARLTIGVEKRSTGKRVRGKCVKPNRRNAAARRCIRYVKVKRKATFNGVRGVNRITIKRKFAGRKLAPGRYRLTLIARDAAGNKSVVKRIRFRIKR